MTKENAIRQLQNIRPGDMFFYVDFDIAKVDGEITVVPSGVYSVVLSCSFSPSTNTNGLFTVLDESGEMCNDVIYAHQIKNGIVKIFPQETK